MDCTKVQELMLDLMNGGSAPADLSAHVSVCADCTKLWQAMQASSAALDEWTAPEPSPYFNTRFQARLAEVKREQSAPSGVMGWLRQSFWRPALAGAMTLAIALGIGLYERPTAQPVNNTANGQQVSPAVNDLQKLDKNEDMYADFEMLDDLQTNNSQPASTTTTTNSSKTEM
jgi:anti-sigma-K factor RskA